MKDFFDYLKEQQSKGNIRYKSEKVSKRSKRKSLPKNKSSEKKKKRTSKKSKK